MAIGYFSSISSNVKRISIFLKRSASMAKQSFSTPDRRTRNKPTLASNLSSMLSNWYLILSLEYESFDFEPIFNSLSFPLGVLFHAISIYSSLSTIEQDSYLPRDKASYRDLDIGTRISPVISLLLLVSIIVVIILYNQSKSYDTLF
jgi:hypothetical protein